MIRIDYSKLDAAILDRIAMGPMNFTKLQGGDVRDISEVLAKSDKNRKPSFRFVDSRLQALRKAGKIKYNTKQGWMLA